MGGPAFASTGFGRPTQHLSLIGQPVHLERQGASSLFFGLGEPAPLGNAAAAATMSRGETMGGSLAASNGDGRVASWAAPPAGHRERERPGGGASAFGQPTPQRPFEESSFGQDAEGGNNRWW